jgi:hypothetical protein
MRVITTELRVEIGDIEIASQGSLVRVLVRFRNAQQADELRDQWRSVACTRSTPS